MVEENVNTENNEHVMNNERKQLLEREKYIDALLSDKELKELLIQKLVDRAMWQKGQHLLTWMPIMPQPTRTLATGTSQLFLYSFNSPPFTFGDPVLITSNCHPSKQPSTYATAPL